MTTTFNPLDHKGIPVDEQVRSWRELDVEPVDPDLADPYTKCRIIAMNGIEVESILFSHQFHRNCPSLEIKHRLAQARYAEQQQQKVVNWLLPGAASALETTISYEQVAVDLTAWLARMEPDPYLKQAYEFGVLEDFDHLYRYANLYEMIQHRKAERIVDSLTEVMPGRPTRLHHRHPIDNVREPYDRAKASPLSKLHTLTLVAAEQQTMNFYLNVGPQYMEPIARRLYQEIAMVEEEHVTHYGSLMDPAETWFERLVLHEYNECYLYHSFLSQESDRRVKAIWELHLNMELGQLQAACDLMRTHEDRDPAELLPAELPAPLTFEPNKAYLRELLATQVDLTTLGTGFVREAHERFQRMQAAVLGEEQAPPSDLVIAEHNRMLGTEDYRLETDGPHPRPDLQQPQPAAAKSWGGVMTSTETPGIAANTAENDAVAFLTGQHMAIRDLFAEVSGAQGRQRADAFARLVRLLAVHETAEEQVLRPVTRTVIDGGDAIADDRVAEERAAKEMLVELEKLGPDAEGFPALFQTLRAAVLEHAHNEEAYEFRYLKQKGQTGQPMTAMIEAAEAIAPTHPHPSVNSATANTLTGPVVAVFDKARDLFGKVFRG